MTFFVGKDKSTHVIYNRLQFFFISFVCVHFVSNVEFNENVFGLEDIRWMAIDSDKQGRPRDCLEWNWSNVGYLNEVLGIENGYHKFIRKLGSTT